MTSGTDELRRLLDERGVEYEGETDEDGWAFTRWHGFDDTGWLAASDELCGLLDLRGRFLFTPEQAIAATLGSCNCSNNCTNGERTETCADVGTVSETYIRPTEEGSICPIPRASVIFEGQKLTFDEEDSARFTEIVKRHLRKLAGLEVAQ